MKGRVLIVAGSDSGGGAGIQADIKTVTALGGYAMTAITALTAQNTTGVFGIHSVPAQFVAQQIQVVFDDIGLDCIKIGMLNRSDIIEAVLEVIRANSINVPIIVDPVMFAKGGASLLDDDAVAVLRELLVPIATLLTPNLPEAQALGKMTASRLDQAKNLARKLQSLGAQSVLLKGGHRDGDVVHDFLLSSSGASDTFSTPRIGTTNTHGTGCTLASAIAVGLAQDMELRDAVVRGRNYVIEAIKTAPGFGHGFGPLNHAHTVEKSSFSMDIT